MRSISNCVAIVLLLSAGCGNILDFLQLNRTTVRLVNNGEFPVEATLNYDDNQEIPEPLLRQSGNELRLEVLPGNSVAFTRNCDNIQALIVADADLVIIGEVGPETSTDVLRDGSDFGCGDLITLTFDHSAVIVDFDVSFSRQRR